MTDTQAQSRVPTTTEGESSSTLSEAADHATEITHHAGNEVGKVLDTTKQQARGVVDGARARLGEEADSATGRAAEALAGTARDLNDLASGQGSPDTQVAQFVREAGDRVDRAATHLRDRGYQGVAEDVSRWARAHPGAFLAAAAGAGFVIGRVMRAADTQGVVDAVKNPTSDPDPSRGLDAPQFELPVANDLATGTTFGSVPPAAGYPSDEGPIDLTGQSDPIAGV